MRYPTEADRITYLSFCIFFKKGNENEKKNEFFHFKEDPTFLF